MVIWVGLVFGALLLVGMRYNLMPSSNATLAWRRSFGFRCFSCIIASLFGQHGEFWNECKIFFFGMI